MIAEQRHPTLLDDGQALAAVAGHEDGDLRDLLGTGTAGGESAAEVGEDLAGLRRQVAGADEVAVLVLGFLAATNTSLLPVATTTWLYVCGDGRSVGLMSWSVTGLASPITLGYLFEIP